MTLLEELIKPRSWYSEWPTAGSHLRFLQRWCRLADVAENELNVNADVNVW